MARGSLRRRMAHIPILVARTGDEMETVRFSRRCRRGHGQTMTEYAVLLVLLFGLVMGILPIYAGSVLRLFSNVADAFGG